MIPCLLLIDQPVLMQQPFSNHNQSYFNAQIVFDDLLTDSRESRLNGLVHSNKEECSN